MRILFGVAFTFLLLSESIGQEILESEFYRRMDLGQELMEKGRYEEADYHFSFILENKKVLPQDLAFLFGRNSYHLNKYKQSINWLNKYIQLKGTKGRYYKQAVNFLDLSESRYLEQQRALFEGVAQDFQKTDYDCGGLDKMICPVCKGDGVIIKPGPIEDIYKTCPYSLGEGYLSCEDYNLFMRGLLDPKNK